MAHPKKVRTIDRLEALAYAAIERGMSYGQLVAMTTKAQRDEIADETAKQLGAKLEYEKPKVIEQPPDPNEKLYFCITCGARVGFRHRYCEKCLAEHIKQRMEADKARQKEAVLRRHSIPAH